MKKNKIQYDNQEVRKMLKEAKRELKKSGYTMEWVLCSPDVYVCLNDPAKYLKPKKKSWLDKLKKYHFLLSGLV